MKQEDKAEAYDKVRKKIAIRFGSNVADEFFAEFEKSKDDRIREALISQFNRFTPNTLFAGLKIKDIAAWLEKQGDYANFRDKAQVGDRITKNEDGVLVNLSQMKRVAKKNEKQCEQKPEENKGNIGGISPNWSEEDEKMMAAIEHHLNNCGASITAILWLKSLKGRYTWKPSDVQIECLSDAIEHYNSLGYPASKLKELLDDLKKLNGGKV